MRTNSGSSVTTASASNTRPTIPTTGARETAAWRLTGAKALDGQAPRTMRTARLNCPLLLAVS